MAKSRKAGIYTYDKPEKFVVINGGDPDLVPIHIPMPPCPDYKEIDGYGLAPSEQLFRYQEMPDKLVRIKQIIRQKNPKVSTKKITNEMIHRELYDNQVFYRDEIAWVRLQIKRHYEGYWFFNNGKPTYMTGANYTFLNFWPIGNNKHPRKLADYRDRDRRWFHGFQYTLTTKEAFYKYRVTYNDTDSRHGVKEKYFNTKKGLNDFVSKHKTSITHEGNFKIIQDGRTIYGMIFAKYRQEGATSRAGFCNWYVTATLNLGMEGGIQSLTDDHAKGVFFNHVAVRLNKLPFFFQLVTDNASIPKGEILFLSTKEKKDDIIKINEHGGVISFKASGERAYDSRTLCYIHHDEIGKNGNQVGANVDVVRRWEVVKKALVLGSTIRGYGMLTSTVGEMSKGGGENMKKLMLASMFQDRDDNGQTDSGLISIFFPSQDGFPGYIDRHGNSIIDDPPEPVQTIDGKFVDHGAVTFLLNKRLKKELAGDDVGLIEEMRDYPMWFKECFMGTARSSVLPVMQINKRIAELALMKGVVRSGRYEWVERFGGPVKWVDDDEGIWISSYTIGSHQANKIVFDEERMCYRPGYESANKFVIGVDIAKHRKDEVQGKKKSYHAAAMFYKHDKTIDPDEGDFPRPRNTWVSKKFVLTSKTRDLTPAKYAEEILKAAIYHGAMVYPEMNIPTIYEKFVEWGYGGYLLYDIIDEHGTYAKMPGYVVSAGERNTTQQDIWEKTEAYTKECCMYENHEELLKDWKDIGGVDEMGKYDLFAAAGAALRGATSMYVKFTEDFDKIYEVEEAPFPVFRF